MVEVEYEWDFNPRDPDYADVQTSMVCFHRRYTIGDIQFDKSLEYDFQQSKWIKQNNNQSWQFDLEDYIIKEYDPAVWLPIYMLDHSGITIQTTPFYGGWDSGQIGYIFMTKETAREIYDIKRITKKYLHQIEKWLKSEVEEYDRYLRGVKLVEREEAEELERQKICKEFDWRYY